MVWLLEQKMLPASNNFGYFLSITQVVHGNKKQSSLLLVYVTSWMQTWFEAALLLHLHPVRVHVLYHHKEIKGSGIQ